MRPGMTVMQTSHTLTLTASGRADETTMAAEKAAQTYLLGLNRSSMSDIEPSGLGADTRSALPALDGAPLSSTYVVSTVLKNGEARSGWPDTEVFTELVLWPQPARTATPAPLAASLRTLLSMCCDLGAVHMHAHAHGPAQTHRQTDWRTGRRAWRGSHLCTSVWAIINKSEFAEAADSAQWIPKASEAGGETQGGRGRPRVNGAPQQGGSQLATITGHNTTTAVTATRHNLPVCKSSLSQALTSSSSVIQQPTCQSNPHNTPPAPTCVCVCVCVLKWSFHLSTCWTSIISSWPKSHKQVTKTIHGTQNLWF